MIGINDSGHYNRFPTPYKEIDWSEFFHFFRGFRTNEERYVFNPEHGPVGTWMIFWVGDCAVAMEKLPKWHLDNGKIVYNFPRLLYIGCEHDYKEVSRPPRNQSGIHKAICAKCGTEIQYDTSD